MSRCFRNVVKLIFITRADDPSRWTIVTKTMPHIGWCNLQVRKGQRSHASENENKRFPKYFSRNLIFCTSLIQSTINYVLLEEHLTFVDLWWFGEKFSIEILQISKAFQVFSEILLPTSTWTFINYVRRRNCREILVVWHFFQTCK